MPRPLILTIALLTAISLSVSAQVPVLVTVGLGGGLLSPQSSDIKGDIYSFYDYPLSKSSYSLDGKLRLRILALPISFIGGLSYHALSDNATIPVTTNSGVVNSSFTSSLSILSVGIGVEYTLLPTPIVKPYASGNLSMNFISGNAKYDNNIIPESKLNSTSRTGISIGLGSLIEFPVLPISFDLQAKYNFANLIGKEFNSNGYSYNGFGGIPQTTSYNLNDAKNPNDPRDHTRAINYLTVALLVNFKIF